MTQGVIYLWFLVRVWSIDQIIRRNHYLINIFLFDFSFSDQHLVVAVLFLQFWWLFDWCSFFQNGKLLTLKLWTQIGCFLLLWSFYRPLPPFKGDSWNAHEWVDGLLIINSSEFFFLTWRSIKCLVRIAFYHISI